MARLSINTVAEVNRQPHLMHQTFFSRVANRTATPFAQDFVKRVRQLEQEVKVGDPEFVSPLTNESLKMWGKYAKDRAQFSASYDELMNYYEELKLLVVSWEEADDAVIIFLRMMRANQGTNKPDPCLESQPESFPRFDNMSNVLIDELNKTGDSDFRGILFVQQRVMTHIVQFYISNHEQLRTRIHSKCLYAVGSPATVSLSLSKTESKDALLSFRSGRSNLLISSAVAEEGLDIPEANCVIRFDSMQTAVSYVQSRGRARKENSSFIVLSERVDRPAALLAEQEMEQHTIASAFKPTKANPVQDKAAQSSRERNAAPVLMQDSTVATALKILNLYCSKTKVLLEEEASGSGSLMRCVLRYESFLREVEVSAVADNRKLAKQRAAIQMIDELRASCGRT
jgi:hypothetical protein